MRTLKLTSAPGFLIALIFCLSSLVACKNDGAKTADHDGDDDKDYVEYRRYITYTRDSVKYTTSKNWEDIDREYNAKKAAAAKDMEKWNAERKAEYEKLNADYEAWKAQYLAEKEAQDKYWLNMGPVYKTVYIESVDAKDMTLQGVTGANIYEVYKNFLQTLKANKNQYTKEEWNEIEVLWEALEDRKNVVHKDIPNSDLVKMAGWKTEYVSIKAFKSDDKTSDKK